MNNIIHRIILFICGCIPTRLGLSYIIKNYGIQYKLILSILLLIIAFGFLYIYAFNLRKTGLEIFGDKIWWNNLRPLHGVLYLIASLLIYYENKNAYLVILIDTFIGLLSFILYHMGYM